MEQVQIVTIPTLPKVVKPDSPPAPLLTLPPVLVMTGEEAQFYGNACQEFKDAGKEDAYSEDELKERYPGLSRANACDWAIYGFTVQDWLTVESQMAEIATYVEQLRAQINFLTGMMDERQAIMDEQIKAIQNVNKK